MKRPLYYTQNNTYQFTIQNLLSCTHIEDNGCTNNLGGTSSTLVLYGIVIYELDRSRWI